MGEDVKKREVEQLLGCEITDGQFDEALVYAKTQCGSIAALVSRKADGGICQKSCFLKIHYGFMQFSA